jgi:hypothetical protein
MAIKKSSSNSSFLYKNISISSLVIVSLVSLLGIGFLLYYVTTNSTEIRSKASGGMNPQNSALLKKLMLSKYPPVISDSICPVDEGELFRITQKKNVPQEDKPDICSREFLQRKEDCTDVIAYTPIPDVQSCKKQMPYWEKKCKPRKVNPGSKMALPPECREN